MRKIKHYIREWLPLCMVLAAFGTIIAIGWPG